MVVLFKVMEFEHKLVVAGVLLILSGLFIFYMLEDSTFDLVTGLVISQSIGGMTGAGIAIFIVGIIFSYKWRKRWNDKWR